MINKSRKKFLFGRVYTVVDEYTDKIDDSCITENDMHKIINEKSIFEMTDYHIKCNTKK